MKKIPTISFIVASLFIGGLTLAHYTGEPLIGADPTPDYLQVKAPNADLIGQKTKNGVVKYAYDSHVAVPNEPDEIVSKRTKFSRTFTTDIIGDTGEFKERLEIIAGVPQFYKNPENGEWTIADYGTTTVKVWDDTLAKVEELTFLQKLRILINVDKVMAVTTSFYPGGLVDGQAIVGINNSFWATLINSAGTSANDSGASLHAAGFRAETADTDKWDRTYKGIFLFDASAIGGETIDSAQFSFVITNATIEDTINESLAIVSSTPATDTALVSGDYTQLGVNEFITQVTFASLTGDGSTYNDLTINAAGVTFMQTALDGTGIIRLGTIASSTLAGVTGEPNWVNGAASRFEVVMSETANITSDPKVTITYTPAVVATILREDDGLMMFK